MKKIAIISTHPIQYNAPFFKFLANRGEVEVKVFYTWGVQSIEKYDPEFDKAIQWDIPLLEGYDYEFLENVAKQPGSHHFKGIINPDAVKSIEDFDPEALLIYGWSFESHLKIMKHFKRKRKLVLFRGDSTNLNDSSFFKAWARKLALNYIFRFVDKAIYCGKANRRYYESAGLNDSQLFFGPHCVDNNRFREKRSPLQISSFRKEIGIPDDDFLFLFAAKLIPLKQPELLINAFRNLKFEKASLLIIGEGVLRSELIESTKKDSKIFWSGFKNQSVMPLVYQSANCFVLCSNSETWGLSVNEAMASGIPAIVSDRCGANEDMIDENITGYSFPYNDCNALKDKMTLAYNSWLSKYDWQRALSEKMKLYSFEGYAKGILHAIQAKGT